jgi:hypothetical protein
MAAIFISHSSADKEAASEMKLWLEAQGHTSLFLDFNPEAGIKGGSNWEQTLYRQLRQSQAVIARRLTGWLPNGALQSWCRLVSEVKGHLSGQGSGLPGGRCLRRHSAHRFYSSTRGRLPNRVKGQSLNSVLYLKFTI